MKTTIMACCILLTALLSNAQTIKELEYFIDEDKGVGKNTRINLSASGDSSYLINVDLTGISAGFHKLYMRAKDNKGKWGFTVKKTIEVTGSFAQPEITAAEYFFDTDPGYGKAKKITVLEQDTAVLENFAAATSALNTGFHKLYIRFKDNAGSWSITVHRNIEIIRTADTIKIVAAEYFFTSDKSYGKATAKTFGEALPDGKFKFKIPYNKIPATADTLFIRVKDSLNNWSLTKLAGFTIQSLTTTAASEEKISNNNIKTLTVFPNPATQTININFELKTQTARLQIFDADGKTVLRSNAESGNNRIDISRLAPGSYLLEVRDGDKIQTAKFIKQ